MGRQQGKDDLALLEAQIAQTRQNIKRDIETLRPQLSATLRSRAPRLVSRWLEKRAATAALAYGGRKPAASKGQSGTGRRAWAPMIVGGAMALVMVIPRILRHRPTPQHEAVRRQGPRMR